ncbi:polysaccharide biosynthesis protein [Aliihoeflea aestuarii]|jgi:FlaA1/EpsC-like NDP-sugar epimerase|nr:polysaccharide biosynthesis protein [Aliihoeflea aestuarii]
MPLKRIGIIRALRPASIALDVAIACIVFLTAYAVVYDIYFFRYIPGIYEKTAAFGLVALVMLFVFSVHKGSWRYVSLPEIYSLVKVGVGTVIVYTVGAFLMSRGDNVPRSVVVLSTLMLVAGLITPRLLYRMAVERQGPFALRWGRDVRPERTVLVLGLTSGAESFLRAWRRSNQAEFQVAGILDSAKASRFERIQGVSVLGRLEDLESILEKLARDDIKVTELIVAEVSPGRKRLSDIVQIATACGLRTTRIPDIAEPTSLDENSAIEPRPIELRDLLGRAEIVSDVGRVGRFIEGRVVLATGAGGSIGSELIRQIAQFSPARIILTDHSEHNAYLLDTEMTERYPDLDIVTRLVSVRDVRRLNALFQEFRPDVVFHAAALKHVPMMEQNPLEAIKTNILGTCNVVDAALAVDVAAFIMISTDKAVNPTNVMGATKRAAEAYCQTMDINSGTTRFKIVRFGNVLGSNGSVVPRFTEQIQAGGPVTVTHPNVVRYFMTIPEAVRLVLNASAQAVDRIEARGEIMVLDMGSPVRIVDLAERMIQLAGLKPGVDIEIAFTGLRAGEKLFEELFDPSEIQSNGPIDGYVIAKPRVMDGDRFLSAVVDLRAVVEAEDAASAISIVRQIVPEYRWKQWSRQNPVPEAIDEAGKQLKAASAN